MSEKKLSEKNDGLEEFPVLALRDVVVFPRMVIPLFVGREQSVKALEYAMTKEQKILLVAQKDAEKEDPAVKDFYRVGALANILQLLRLPDGTLKVLVEGVVRKKIVRFSTKADYVSARAVSFDTQDDAALKDTEGLKRSLLSQFEQYIQLNKKVPPEVINSVSNIEELDSLTDMISAHMSFKISERQALLAELSLVSRVQLLMSYLEREIDLLHVEKKIRGKVKGQIEKNQREYYLSEQIKAIQSELDEGEGGYGDLLQLETKIKEAKMPKEAHDKTISELKKLKAMSPMSAEATVSRNYIDTMINVPWKKKSKISKSLSKAEEILDQDHYGLEKIKERMVEYLAVQQRVKKLKAPILCFVGPPGVGKTSLGSSIARATGREFARISLGGIRDEAEIRGHRRTYIGSMPGKIIQKLQKVKVTNPLFMLDEIDKMAADFRGDPSSALLEVLDPEQNHAFSDHYIEVDYDLSDVMFIATSNTMNIPPALLDRMEVIRLPGYTEDEKCHIATRHLIPKEIEATGLKKSEIKITDGAIKDIIRYYTREAGVRSLNREIAKLCQKTVKRLITNTKKKSISIGSKNIEDYLGVKRYRFGLAEKKDQVGQVTGLAWTEVGGELLKVEACLVPGKGKNLSTGQLGDVMQESVQAAITVLRSRSESLNITADFYQKTDIHIHVPEGGTPKDGPSAGIAMCTALCSALTSIPVKSDVAMTGEITLRGEVLPIGGLKEKLLAALRGGIKTVIIPDDNKRELKEMPSKIKDHLNIVPVQWIEQVLEVALVKSVNISLTKKSRGSTMGS